MKTMKAALLTTTPVKQCNQIVNKSIGTCMFTMPNAVVSDHKVSSKVKTTQSLVFTAIACSKLFYYGTHVEIRRT